LFERSIDGKVGTAKFNVVVNAVNPSGTFCCYRGLIEFYGGTGELKGMTASGVFTNDLVNGRQFFLDVIFR
jgi:hypothetical protein